MVLPLLGLLGGVIGAIGASSAARAQASAAEKDRQAANSVYQDQKRMTRPYRQDGRKYRNALNFENGIGARPSNYAGFQGTPGYQFQLAEGLDAAESGAAARGGLMSGAALQALQARGNGLASMEYGNYLNRLGQGVDRGIGAINMTANAGQNFVSNNSNALAGIGNAKAAGAIGVSNAFNNGLQNYIGLSQYQNGLNSGGGYA